MLGAGQSLVDKEGGKARMRRGAKSLDTASSTSQNQDIKEERARKAHDDKFSRNKKSGGTFNGRAIMKARGGTFKGTF